MPRSYLSGHLIVPEHTTPMWPEKEQASRGIPITVDGFYSYCGNFNLNIIPPLRLNLECSSDCIGSKTKYTCTATASGAIAPYTFAWTNATPGSPSTANPNTAYRTLTPGEP